MLHQTELFLTTHAHTHTHTRTHTHTHTPHVHFVTFTFRHNTNFSIVILCMLWHTKTHTHPPNPLSLTNSHIHTHSTRTQLGSASQASDTVVSWLQPWGQLVEDMSVTSLCHGNNCLTLRWSEAPFSLLQLQHHPITYTVMYVHTQFSLLYTSLFTVTPVHNHLVILIISIHIACRRSS